MFGRRKATLDITFFKVSDKISDEYSPVPAIKNLPEWYKKTNQYMNNEKSYSEAGTSGTIKKCIPVLDAISSGYLILAPCDISIVWDDISYEFSVPNQMQNVISFHPIEQAEMHPNRKDDIASVPKFINPWGIKTPPGYSCLFIPPMHRDNNISILPGIVDTDRYNSPVQLPFTLNKYKQNDLIKAGTPLAQVVPFKRDGWSMNVSADTSFMSKSKTKIDSIFFDAYKKLFWDRKSYK